LPYFAAVAAAALTLSIAGPKSALADYYDSAAPPVDQSADTDSEFIDNGTVASAFDWTQVPANQQVPISRAAFTRSGYQLYDTVGETILVPFSNDNLYVMKFGVSDNGTTYFVNTGDAPVLFIPRNGYLDNDSMPGARWYPFTQDWHPQEPVYLGVAPSWDLFVGMGWYPDMACYGGYWSEYGYAFAPCLGLDFVIGADNWFGWDSYWRYCDHHPGFHIDNDDRWGKRPHGPTGSFPGRGPTFNGGFRANEPIRTEHPTFPTSGGFRGIEPMRIEHPTSTGGSFRVTEPIRTYRNPPSDGGYRSDPQPFRGFDRAPAEPARTFQGAERPWNNSDWNSNRPSYVDHGWSNRSTYSAPQPQYHPNFGGGSGGSRFSGGDGWSRSSGGGSSHDDRRSSFSGGGGGGGGGYRSSGGGGGWGHR
jgi:hypothetical protein